MQEQFEPITLLIPDSARGERLDAFLATALTEFSRSRIKSLMISGDIVVDGKPAKPKDSALPGATVSVSLPPPEPATTQPEDIPLTYLHEDADLAVVDKPSGLVVHPGSGNRSGTLVNALLHHFGGLSSIGGVERPGIVHRLDKDTSGCIVVARNDFTHEHLSGQFASRTVIKQYLAVTSGIPSPTSATVKTNIGRNPGNRQKMAVLDPPQGKHAVTDYHVLGARQKSALVMCDLHTGRTHQIRVHMKHLGHPLLGDEIYGRRNSSDATTRLMLHAWRIQFTHPRTGERLQFESDIPPEYSPWLAVSSLPPG